jgi:hypothetical protein
LQKEFIQRIDFCDAEQLLEIVHQADWFGQLGLNRLTPIEQRISL